ncbi:MAG: PhnD/SsuA/transferrin family substrate-binding protein [Thermodesulfobacteriota bacterium]
MTHPPHRFWPCRLLAVALSLILAVLAIARPGAAQPFYYFYPDSPQSNIGLLKREMDRFLASVDPHLTFQPFVHLVDLERQLAAAPPALAVMPAWLLSRHGAALGLVPLLRPVQDGATSYRKVLLVAKDAGLTPGTLAGRTVATTSLGATPGDLLEAMLPPDSGVRVRELRVVTVPKDFDALLALVFRQVDAALVVKHNLAAISAANPTLTANLLPLLETGEMPLPVLCYRHGILSADQLERLRHALAATEASSSRIQLLEALQIDGWQTIAH